VSSRTISTRSRTGAGVTPEVPAVGEVVPVMGETPSAEEGPLVGDAPPMGDAPPAGGVETDPTDFGDEDYLVLFDGRRGIDAVNGPVNVQPGMSARPPPALIDSQMAFALIEPSKEVILHVTKLLALKGRKEQRFRDAFKGMVSVIAAEHKYNLKSIQLCLLS